MKRVLFFLIAVIIFLPAGCIFDKSEDSDKKSITIDHVIINEVYYSNNYKKAWIELYNPTDIDFDVSYWKIHDKNKIYQTVNCPAFDFPPNTIIGSKEHVLAVANTDSFFTYFTKPENVKLFSGCLFPTDNNGIYLLQGNGLELTTVDSLEWGSTATHSVEDGHSLARYVDWPDTDDHQEGFYDESIPSPGMENRKRD